jgi:uncharacterized protein YjbI with pentapeptide repeats
MIRAQFLPWLFARATPTPTPSPSATLTSPQVVAAIIAASVAFLTLIGTLLTAYFSRRATKRDLEEQREHLDRTLGEQRTRTLNERFATAAGQLGSDKPPAVRLAGVYAMAGLADDWPENRQTCVDVLCGYLRMPYEPKPGDDVPRPEWLAFWASRQVRHTVIRVITAHLKPDAAVSWQGLRLDFTDVVFDGGDFRGAEFSGGQVLFDRAVFSSGAPVDFSRAVFSGGSVSFSGAAFSGGTVDFHGVVFVGGEVDFGSATFSGGTVRFYGAEFAGGGVGFRSAQFSGGSVSFSGAEFSGGEVDFKYAGFSGGTVDFGGAKFSGGEVSFSTAGFSGGEVGFANAKFADGKVRFERAEFSGGKVGFYHATFSGGQVEFAGAGFSDGMVDFYGAEFSGGTVSFVGAAFSGGTVDLSTPVDWSFPPALAERSHSSGLTPRSRRSAA